MTSYYETKIQAFYLELLEKFLPVEGLKIIAVAHMVPNALTFLPALDKLGKLSLVLPKPKTVERPEFLKISESFDTYELSRDWASNAKAVVDTLSRIGVVDDDLVIVDIGGYFAEALPAISELYRGSINGVLEGTENGLKRYEEMLDTGSPALPPVISVARSPLKLPEDYLVASSIVFSIEAVLREDLSEILQTRRACVIGYGRIGRAVAQILRDRGITTEIFDTDPMKLAEAAARGYKSHLNFQDAILGKSIVIGATGNVSICSKKVQQLENRCVLAGVTSLDDEFDFSDAKLSEKSVGANTTQLDYTGRRIGEHILLLGGENAINFLHGAVIGPAMQLIEGEKIAAVCALRDREFVGAGKGSTYELHDEDRSAVASIWNRHFL